MSFRCQPELLAVSLAVSLGVALLGCDSTLGLNFDLGLDPGPEQDEPEPVDIDKSKAPAKNQPVPNSKKGIVDLGTAVYPEGTKPAGAIAYTFNVPPQHRIGYRVSDAEQKSITKFYESFAKSVSYKRMGSKSFQWIPPTGCPSSMACVYKKLITRTHDDVLAISQLFKKRADQGKLTSLHVAMMALSYVQTIPYEIPDDPFGLKPPPLVVADQKGDCDSKALLLYMILNQLGIETVILSSQAHKHSLAGIALPSNGSSFRWKDRRYAFAETTAKGAPLGYMPPEFTSPNDWIVELSP